MKNLLASAIVLALVWPAGCAPRDPVPVRTTAARGCDTPLGWVPHGGTASGYLNPVEFGGAACQSASLACQDGVWSGPILHASCTSMPLVEAPPPPAP